MKLAFGVSYEEYWRIIPFAYERCFGKGWSDLLANIYGITFVGMYGIHGGGCGRRRNTWDRGKTYHRIYINAQY